MAKKILRMTIQFDVDENLMCDEETIQEEFDNSPRKLVEWFIENGDSIWEIMCWADDEPILKNVEEIEIEE